MIFTFQVSWNRNSEREEAKENIQQGQTWMWLFQKCFTKSVALSATDNGGVSNCGVLCIGYVIFFLLTLSTSECLKLFWLHLHVQTGWFLLIKCANVTFPIALQSSIHLTFNVWRCLSCLTTTASTPTQDGSLTAWCVLDIQREARMPVRYTAHTHSTKQKPRQNVDILGKN